MSATLKEDKPCPSCGKPLPAGALAGLCPACLLAQGAETETGGRRAVSFEPPPLAEVAKLFPQLEILDLLGAGGMGAVYKARQPALDRLVALKILPATSAAGVNFAERFNREARALARLSHPNIVAVHEFGQAGALSFFIMEFVDGANLRQLEQGGRLAPREALQIIPQICDALQYAHDEGVVHRDIKPENVLVDRKGRVKIADFGLAKILGTDVESLRLTAEGQVMGTPHYMAPEQVERPLAVDHRADIYALGVVFYEMLTGDLPLGKFSPPSRKVQVDVRLDDVVLRALENDPARRYQHASEVKTQVENIASTPSATTAAASGQRPAIEFVRFAGFPLLAKQGERTRLNWKGVVQAFAVIFGLLTVVFGVVSLLTGRSLWDWLGIIGLPSVLVRIAVSAAAVLLGIRCATLAKNRPQVTPTESPRTPQGTAILPTQRLSRKAVIGVCWAAAFFAGGLLYFMAHTTVTVTGDAPPPPPSARWWQIILGVTVLPLSLTAPIGATLLGWLAVGDIRRSQGRISGLPLAVFDGLLFPLLIANGLIVWLWGTSVRALAQSQGVSPSSGFWPAISTVGTVLLCLVTTWGISRRVWRAVSQSAAKTSPNTEWWWSTKHGGVVIGVLCVLIIGLVANRRFSADGRPNEGIAHLAIRDVQTGHLVAKLPGSGTVELLAVGERYGAPNGWWAPDGTPLTNALYEVREGVDNVMGNRVPKEVLVRAIGLPDGTSQAGIEAEPASGSGWGGEVFLDGERVPGVRQVRLAWDASVRKANLRFGYAIEPWRTIAMHDAKYRSRQNRHLTTDPAWTINFPHAPTETRDGAQIALIFGPGDRLWAHRVVAIDHNDVEHSYSQAKGTPIEKLTLWTYTFHRLSLASVKEFRLQVRPVYWIEFRDVALTPSVPLPPAEPRSAAAESIYSGTGRLLEEPPRVRFLAWQDDWKRISGRAASHADGSLVSEANEIKLLSRVPPSGLEVLATAPADQDGILHLWFSHPFFRRESLVAVTVLDIDGQEFSLGAHGARASGSHNPNSSNGEVGWITHTFSVGNRNRLPNALTLRLHYVIGPLEKQQEVAVDYHGLMSLEGNSQLNGIGQDAEGKSFVAIAVDAQKIGPRQFGVVAVLRNGGTIDPSGGGSGGNSGSGVRVQRFEFDAPLAQIARFRIGTRLIRTLEYKDVILPKPAWSLE